MVKSAYGATMRTRVQLLPFIQQVESSVHTCNLRPEWQEGRRITRDLLDSASNLTEPASMTRSRETEDTQHVRHRDGGRGINSF